MNLRLLMGGLALSAALAHPPTIAVAQVDPTVQQVNWAQTQAVDLSQVRSHLSAQNWQAADEETRRILQRFVHPQGDIYGEPIPTLIPPEVLQRLDQLWIEASGGRFGFSVQQPIWAEVRAQNPVDSAVAAKGFGDQVGWTRPVPDYDNYLAPEWLTQRELTYSIDAPVGHLPWAGIDSAQIDAILSQQGCGSCMIDAVYLQGERFGRYLPLLFGWLQTALDLPVPAIGSWQQPRLARTIDLRSLYPDSQCPITSPASAISPNGALIAIGSYSYERSCITANNSTLALWNADAGTRRITLLRGQAMERWTYAGADQEPTTEGNRIVGDVVNALAFTADSRLVAAGLSNGTVQVWRTDNAELVNIFHGHRYAVRAIALSPDGQTLATASADYTINLWHLPTGRHIKTLYPRTSDGFVRALLISPDGQQMAIATDKNTLQLWDIATGRPVRTLVDQATNLYPPLPLAFSPNGQTLATADDDNSIKLWNATTGARQITLTGHTEPVRHLAFSPDGLHLATSDGKIARLWNLQTYETVHTLTLNQSAGHPIQPTNLGEVVFSPDGQTLAASTLLLPLTESEPIPRQGITLWSVATGQPLSQLHVVGPFQFSPNGQFLMAQGQRVQLWQPYSSLVR
jgi:WD40 repeat protein